MSRANDVGSCAPEMGTTHAMTTSAHPHISDVTKVCLITQPSVVETRVHDTTSMSGRTSSGSRAVQNLLAFPVPMHFLALAIAPRGHDHGHGVRESGFNASIGRFPVAHARQPIVRVGFEVVVLFDG